MTLSSGTRLGAYEIVAPLSIGEAPDFSWGATALFGYRYYDIQNDKGAVETDIRFYGPMVGVAFKF